MSYFTTMSVKKQLTTCTLSLPYKHLPMQLTVCVIILLCCGLRVGRTNVCITFAVLCNFSLECVLGIQHVVYLLTEYIIIMYYMFFFPLFFAGLTVNEERPTAVQSQVQPATKGGSHIDTSAISAYGVPPNSGV